MTPKKKTSISDEKLKEILIDGINSGAGFILNKSNFYEHIRTIHKIEKQRCLRFYDKHYSEAHQERNRLKQERGIEQAEQAVKSAILTKNERMEIASKIAKGEAWTVRGNLIVPTGNDRLKALEYLSKIEGDFAPVKQDVTSDGESISPINNEKLEKLLSKLR